MGTRASSTFLWEPIPAFQRLRGTEPSQEGFLCAGNGPTTRSRELAPNFGRFSLRFLLSLTPFPEQGWDVDMHFSFLLSARHEDVPIHLRAVFIQGVSSCHPHSQVAAGSSLLMCISMSCCLLQPGGSKPQTAFSSPFWAALPNICISFFHTLLSPAAVALCILAAPLCRRD